MSLDLLTRPDAEPKTGQGEGHASHIVPPDGKRTAAAIVTEARIFGYEVEALCGHRWVPQRDPQQYPVCQACKEIWEQRFSPDAELPGG